MNTSVKHNDEFSKSATGILLANLQQVFNHTLFEVIKNRITSETDIEEIIGKYSSLWPVPDDVLVTLTDTVLNFKIKLHNSDKLTCDFLAAQRHKTQFLVFHHGRTHYYNTVPDDVLKMKKSILFWADFSNNEFYTFGEAFPKNEWLEPVAEQMLRFVCDNRNAGKIIDFDKLYSNICHKDSYQNTDKLRNCIAVRQNQINSLGMEKLFITVSDSSAENKEKVLRLRGQDKYKIGQKTMNRVCIIRKVPKL